MLKILRPTLALPRIFSRRIQRPPLEYVRRRDRGAIVASGVKFGDIQINDVNIDEVGIRLFGVDVFVRRWFTSDVPHEVSAFIPRAEVEFKQGFLRKTVKMTLNSITIVHAPRFPPTRP
ncbi:MAG TPA: hypothetical protein GX507_01805 [Clostridia bacterium]|nr:hypothetical protein [Clostridia bacterium]